MKLFLHIGAHKTGTSLFQKLLQQNRNGATWYYPQTVLWNADRSHNQLGIYFWDKMRPDLKTRSYEKVLAGLLHEIEGQQHVIISSELLEKVPLIGRAKRLGNFISILRDKGFEIRVLYTVRRQDFLIDSMFKQFVAGFDTRFHGRIKQFIRMKQNGLNFLPVISGWEALAGEGNVIVAPYLEGDIKQTMRNLASLIDVDLPSDVQAPAVVNQSLEGDCLRFKHGINRLIQDRKFNSRLIRNLSRIQSEVWDGRKTSLFPERDRQMFLSRFAADNAVVARHLSSDADRWLHSAPTGGELFRPVDAAVYDTVLTEIRKINQPFSRDLVKVLKALPAP